MNALTRTVASLLTLLVAANAQIPSHATHLNPSSGASRFHVLHLDDVVVTLSVGTRSSCSTDGGTTWAVVNGLTMEALYDVAVVGQTVVVVGVDYGFGFPDTW